MIEPLVRGTAQIWTKLDYGLNVRDSGEFNWDKVKGLKKTLLNVLDQDFRPRFSKLGAGSRKSLVHGRFCVHMRHRCNRCQMCFKSPAFYRYTKTQ